MTTTPPCRLYVLVATQAPVALIVRRGPSDWWRLLKWDLERLGVETGASFRGTLYPRRSDISPDGRLFGYFALRGSAPPWDAYFAVSKLPWLTALAAWRTGGTWTGGCQFFDDGRLAIAGCLETQPFHGHYPKIVVGGMSADWVGRDLQNERKRGWQPAPDDALDRMHAIGVAIPQTATIIRRVQPGQGGAALLLAHLGVDFSRPSVEGVQLCYAREAADGSIMALPEAAWADWDWQGRQLMATRDGAVCVLEQRGDAWTKTWSHDLRDLVPEPVEAPKWARGW